MLRLSDKRNKGTLINDHPTARLLIQPRCARYEDRQFEQVFSVTLIVIFRLSGRTQTWEIN